MPLLEGGQECLSGLPSAQPRNQDATCNLSHSPGRRWHAPSDLAGVGPTDEGGGSNQALGLGVAEELANGQSSHGRVIRQLRTVGQVNCPRPAEYAVAGEGRDTLRPMSDTDDDDADIRRPWTLGKRVRLAMRLKGWAGWGAQQKLCQASGIGRSYVSAILGDGEKMQNPPPGRTQRVGPGLDPHPRPSRVVDVHRPRARGLTGFAGFPRPSRACDTCTSCGPARHARPPRTRCSATSTRALFQPGDAGPVAQRRGRATAVPTLPFRSPYPRRPAHPHET